MVVWPKWFCVCVVEVGEDGLVEVGVWLCGRGVRVVVWSRCACGCVVEVCVWLCSPGGRVVVWSRWFFGCVVEVGAWLCGPGGRVVVWPK